MTESWHDFIPKTLNKHDLEVRGSGGDCLGLMRNREFGLIHKVVNPAASSFRFAASREDNMTIEEMLSQAASRLNSIFEWISENSDSPVREDLVVPYFSVVGVVSEQTTVTHLLATQSFINGIGINEAIRNPIFAIPWGGFYSDFRSEFLRCVSTALEVSDFDDHQKNVLKDLRANLSLTNNNAIAYIEEGQVSFKVIDLT